MILTHGRRLIARAVVAAAVAILATASNSDKLTRIKLSTETPREPLSGFSRSIPTAAKPTTTSGSTRTGSGNAFSRTPLTWRRRSSTCALRQTAPPKTRTAFSSSLSRSTCWAKGHLPPKRVRRTTGSTRKLRSRSSSRVPSLTKRLDTARVGSISAQRWRCLQNWLEHDPDPTTEINERWLEHVYRAFLSETRFASKTPARRGWETERGQALIKFGAPDQIRTTLEGHKPLDGRIETWASLGSAQGFVLSFQDEYLNGNCTVPIDDEFCARVLSDTPPLTALVSESTPIPGELDVVAFRDSDTSSSVYITYGANDDSLERRLRTWAIKTFVARTAFFDKEGRPRAYYADTLDADSLPRDAARNRRSNQWAKRYALPFDSHRVSFCFEDERSLTQSLASAGISTFRFLGGSLALSDILLHTTLASAANTVIHRGHRSFSVNPRRAYAPSETLHLYVELYNLTLSDRTGEYVLAVAAVDRISGERVGVSRAFAKLRSVVNDRGP